jgi:hypothetical protein
MTDVKDESTIHPLPNKEDYEPHLKALFDEHKGSRFNMRALTSMVLQRMGCNQASFNRWSDHLENYIRTQADDPKSDIRSAMGKGGGIYRFSDSPDGKWHAGLEAVFKQYGDISIPIAAVVAMILRDTGDVTPANFFDKNKSCQNYINRISRSPGSGYIWKSNEADGPHILKHEETTKVAHPGANEFTRKVEELIHLIKLTERYDTDSRIDFVAEIIKACANQISRGSYSNEQES